jgi:hypothetical protein
LKGEFFHKFPDFRDFRDQPHHSIKQHEQALPETAATLVRVLPAGMLWN